MIQHGGLADGDDQSTFGTVVPHSGTAGKVYARTRLDEIVIRRAAS